jgi:hypothetical protein
LENEISRHPDTNFVFKLTFNLDSTTKLDKNTTPDNADLQLPEPKERTNMNQSNPSTALLGSALELAEPTTEQIAEFERAATYVGPQCGGGPGFAINKVFFAREAATEPYVAVHPNSVDPAYLLEIAELLDEVGNLADRDVAAGLIELFESRTNMDMGYIRDHADILDDWPKDDLRKLIRAIKGDCVSGIVPIIKNTQTPLEKGTPTYQTSTRTKQIQTVDQTQYREYQTRSPFPTDGVWKPNN